MKRVTTMVKLCLCFLLVSSIIDIFLIKKIMLSIYPFYFPAAVYSYNQIKKVSINYEKQTDFLAASNLSLIIANILLMLVGGLNGFIFTLFIGFITILLPKNYRVGGDNLLKKIKERGVSIWELEERENEYVVLIKNNVIKELLYRKPFRLRIKDRIKSNNTIGFEMTNYFLHSSNLNKKEKEKLRNSFLAIEEAVIEVIKSNPRYRLTFLTEDVERNYDHIIENELMKK